MAETRGEHFPPKHPSTAGTCSEHSDITHTKQHFLMLDIKEPTCTVITTLIYSVDSPLCCFSHPGTTDVPVSSASSRQVHRQLDQVFYLAEPQCVGQKCGLPHRAPSVQSGRLVGGTSVLLTNPTHGYQCCTFTSTSDKRGNYFTYTCKPSNFNLNSV